MYANGRRRNTYDFSVHYVRGVAYILARCVIFYIRDVFFVRILPNEIRYYVRGTRDGARSIGTVRVTRIDVSICTKQNKQTLDHRRFFLSTAGNLTLGRARSWKDARRAAGFS